MAEEIENQNQWDEISIDIRPKRARQEVLRQQQRLECRLEIINIAFTK